MIKQFAKEHLFFFGCVLFCLTLPYRYTNIAIVIMALGWLLEGNWSARWKLFTDHSMGFWTMILFIIWLLSGVYSEDTLTWSKKIETKLPLFFFPLMIFSSSLTHSRIVFILKSFLIGTLLATGYCLIIAYINYTKHSEISFFFYHKLSSPLSVSAIYLANYLSLCITILLFLKKELIITSTWRYILIVSILFMIGLLSSLSVLGFLFIVGILLGIEYFKIDHLLGKRILIAAFSIGIFFTIIFSLPYTKNKILKMSNLEYRMDYPDSMWNSITIRLAKWKGAVGVIKEHPIIGVGIGDQEEALRNSYQQLNFLEGLRNNYNEHNQYLATMVSIGIPGLVALLMIFFVPARGAINGNDKLLLAFLLMIAISFMTENFLNLQKGVTFFAFFYALLIKRFHFTQIQ